MVAFGSSFELQLAPFLAVIVGGGIGLYAALSARNPSPAIGWASAILPALTFVGITGFLQGNTLQVLLVATAAYGFTTIALLVPAIEACSISLPAEAQLVTSDFSRLRTLSLLWRISSA